MATVVFWSQLSYNHQPSNNTCISQRVGGLGASCSCASADCFGCLVDYPSVCLRCRNGLYSHNGVCRLSCPEGTRAIGTTRFGRTCMYPYVCNSNGETERGGYCICERTGCTSCNVTADDSICTSCINERYLSDGRCLLTAICRGVRVEGSPFSESCNCGNPDCFRCRIRRDGTSECLRCRNKKYFYQGECLTSCPIDKGVVKSRFIGSFGRECLTPFECRGNRIITSDHEASSSPCRCVQHSCFLCSFDAGGETCKRCRDGRYLFNHTCMDLCPQGMTAYGFRNFGRECREPFICSGDRDPLQRSCTCDWERRCHTCEWKGGNLPRVAACTMCRWVWFSFSSIS